MGIIDNITNPITDSVNSLFGIGEDIGASIGKTITGIFTNTIDIITKTINEIISGILTQSVGLFGVSIPFWIFLALGLVVLYRL